MPTTAQFLIFVGMWCLDYALAMEHDFADPDGPQAGDFLALLVVTVFIAPAVFVTLMGS